MMDSRDLSRFESVMIDDLVPDSLSEEALKEELYALAWNIRSWDLEYVNGAERTQSLARLLTGKAREKAQELKDHLTDLQDEDVPLEAALSDSRATVEKFRGRFAEEKKKQDARTELILQRLESRRRGEEKVSIAMAEFRGKLDHRKWKMDELRKAMSWYNELLGMRCEYSNGNGTRACKTPPSE